MIHKFLVVRANGAKTALGEYVATVPIVEQLSDPSFRLKVYEWESDGQTFTRLIDGNETVTARPLPDGSGIVVLQDADTFGPDNVVVVDANNEIRQRVSNPYRVSKFFIAGDNFWFYEIKVDANEIIFKIQVRRKLAGRPHDAVPIYEASYDPTSLKFLKLEWRPWT